MVEILINKDHMVDIINTLHGTTMIEEEAINKVAGHNLEPGQGQLFANFNEIYRHIGRCPACEEWRYPNEFQEGLCPDCLEDELRGE